MKAKLFAIFSVICVLFVCGSAFVSPAAVSTKTIAEEKAVKADVNSARFLNMLNHSYSYGEDLNSADTLAFNAVFALLDYREGDYLKTSHIKDYLKDMYGVEIEEIVAFDEDFEAPAGYVAIIPMGYTEYKHINADVIENEDGSFTVTTDVMVFPHDSEEYTAKATTLFVKNENSAFGYNIISSDIVSDLDCADI